MQVFLTTEDVLKSNVVPSLLLKSWRIFILLRQGLDRNWLNKLWHLQLIRLIRSFIWSKCCKVLSALKLVEFVKLGGWGWTLFKLRLFNNNVVLHRSVPLTQGIFSFHYLTLSLFHDLANSLRVHVTAFIAYSTTTRTHCSKSSWTAINLTFWFDLVSLDCLFNAF